MKTSRRRRRRRQRGKQEKASPRAVRQMHDTAAKKKVIQIIAMYVKQQKIKSTSNVVGSETKSVSFDTT